jgi:hypothetical protein
MAEDGKRSELSELFDLLRRYVVQETLEPLKQVGRVLAFGSGAAVFLGIGLVLLLVGLLRALETETGTLFAGEWSWAPYFLTVIAGAIGLGLAAAVLLKGGSKAATK